MGTVEATERQKTALRLLRALRRTTAFPAPQNWYDLPASQQGQLPALQNWYGSLYIDLFESLQYDSNQRQARFTVAAIADIINKASSSFPFRFTAQTEDRGTWFTTTAEVRFLGINIRSWLIAFDEQSQNFRVYELWGRTTETAPATFLEAQVPKLPQHINLSAPPPESYFQFVFFNYRDQQTGNRVEEILVYNLT